MTQGENTLFRYQDVSPKDKQTLKGYIAALARLDPRQYNRQTQFAYWVNLYNALTVNLILEHYPVESITDIGGFFSFGPWNEKIITITGKPLTLNDIEHRILRPIWQDSRIHYVVNCASLGCPNLSPTAFTPQNTEQQLNNAAIKFINSKKGVSVSGKRYVLSSIYDWYAEDFGHTTSQVIAAINKYKNGKKLDTNNQQIDYQYDWKLNEASTNK